MAGPQAQRPHTNSEGASSARRALHPPECVEIVVDSRCQSVDDNCDNNDVEQGSSKKVRYKHRPLFWRIFTYLRTAWTGVNFSSGSGNYNFIFFKLNFRTLKINF